MLEDDFSSRIEDNLARIKDDHSSRIKKRIMLVGLKTTLLEE